MQQPSRADVMAGIETLRLVVVVGVNIVVKLSNHVAHYAVLLGSHPEKAEPQSMARSAGDING